MKTANQASSDLDPSLLEAPSSSIRSYKVEVVSCERNREDNDEVGQNTHNGIRSS
jgi:hypothetical protein